MIDQSELNFENLLTAVRKEDLKGLVLYLQDGKFLNDQDEKGNTPLITACETNQTKLVDIILSIGVEIDLSNKANETALTVAAQVGNLSMVELLVAFSADCNHQDEDGRTPLMHAIMAKNMEIMQFLIGSGTNLDIIDEFGMTALMYSLKYFGIKQMEDILDDSKKALLQKQITELEEKQLEENNSKTIIQGDSKENEKSEVIVKDDSTSSPSNSSIKIISDDNENASNEKNKIDQSRHSKSDEHSDEEELKINENAETTTVKGSKTSKQDSNEDSSPEILANEDIDGLLDSIKISGSLGDQDEEISKTIISGSKNPSDSEQQKNSLFKGNKGSSNLEGEGTTTIKSLNNESKEDATNFSSPKGKKMDLPEMEEKIVKALEKIPQAAKKKRELKKLKKDNFKLDEFSKSISNMTDHLNSDGENSLIKGNPSSGNQEESEVHLNGRVQGSTSEEGNSLVKGQGPDKDLNISTDQKSSNKVIKETTLTIDKNQEVPVTSLDLDNEGNQEEKTLVEGAELDIEAKNEVPKAPSESEVLKEKKNPKSIAEEGSPSMPSDMALDVELEKNKELKSTGMEETLSTKTGTKIEKSNVLDEKNSSFMKHEGEREAIVDKQKYGLNKDDINKESSENNKEILKGKVAQEKEEEKVTLVKGEAEKIEEGKTVLKGPVKTEEISLVVSESKEKETEEPQVNLDQALDFPKGKINEKNKRGQTHLMVAAGKGELDKVLLLLKHDADTSMKDFNGFSALMFAAQSGHIEIVKKLVTAKDDLDVKNAKGFTALSLAVIKNRPEIISALIEAGANKEIKISGETLLTLAVSKDATQAIKILVTLGSDPLEKNRKGRSAVEMAKKLKKKKIIAFFSKYMAILLK